MDEPTSSDRTIADRQADEDLARARSEQRSQANEMLGMGAGIGALGVVTATAFGAVCPACVIAAPALIGVGLYKRYRCRAARSETETAAEIPGEAARQT